MPRLLHQLTASELFVKVGLRSFRIPRSLFSRPGDTPNYFTTVLSTVYSLIEPSGSHDFIRPQQFAPPTVSCRSSDLFQDLLSLLEGGCPDEIIKSESHRRCLINECKFYRFQNLEQQILPATIHSNRFRQTEEITLNLEDVQPMNITIDSTRMGYKTLFYSRPFVDKQHPRELIFQISNDETVALIKSPPLIWEVSFYDETRQRVQKLLNLVAERFGCQKNIGLHGYVIDVNDAAIELNNQPLDPLTVCTGDESKGNHEYTNTQDDDCRKNECEKADLNNKSSNNSNQNNDNTTITQSSIDNNDQRRSISNIDNGIGSKINSVTVVKKRKLGPQSPLQMTCSRSLWRIKICADKMLTLQLVRAECCCGQRYSNMVRKFL